MSRTMHRKLRWAALGLAWMLLAINHSSAQSFGLAVTNSPNPVTVNQSLTFTIQVTNRAGIQVNNVFVTNSFSAPIVYVASTNSFFGSVVTNSNTVTFQINSFPVAQAALITLVVSPTTFGSLTNMITSFSLLTTNVTTNVATTVISGEPDLAINIAGPAQPVLVNDLMTYKLTASNQGGGAATNIVVTNTFPADVRLIRYSPSNQVSVASQSLQWNIVTLAGGGFSNLSVTIQPTNVGVTAISASVSAAGALDPNPTNDTATTNITIGALTAGSLVASNVSIMEFNPQTGLMEQTVRLANLGTNAVASARIIVTGLTNRLYNAVGTNGSDPFVVYASALDTNQSVDLVFEYFVPTRDPIVVQDSQLHPYEMPAFNLSPPAGTPFAITLITNLSSGQIVIEFQSTPGRSYTVLYSDNMFFSNSLAAQPAIVAPADRVQWIDDGPPKTVSRPADVMSRYYRVIQNP